MLLEFLGEETDTESFWQQVKTNLQAGRIRLLFVADIIPPELQRIVEFLNEQMDPAGVLALEIKQYVGQGLRTLVPQVIGNTSAAQQNKNVSRQSGKQWTEETYLQRLEEQQGAGAVTVAQTVIRWANSNNINIYYGKGTSSASLIPWFNHKEIGYQLFCIYSYGSIEIYFQYLLKKPLFASEEKRHDLREKLNQISGISIPPDGVTRRPGFPISALEVEESMNMFLGIFDKVIAEIKSL